MAARESDEVQGHFDDVADRYDRTLPEHVQAHYRKKRARLIGLFLRRGLGLDVGCGTGRLMEALKPYGRVVGVDFSSGMLRVARDEDRGRAAGARSDRLPFADATFEVVFSVALMHHLAAPELVAATIREMVRVARPGGYVIIWDHNPRNPFWPAIMRKAPQDTGEERLLPAPEMEHTLRGCGVRRITTFQSGFVPPFVPRWLVGLAAVVEGVLEHVPLLRRIAAHNVILARK